MSATEYPADVATKLAPFLEEERVADVNAHTHPVLSPPTAQQLVHLLDAAWAATTIDEEGRRTVFTLMFVEREAIEKTSWRPLIFATPRQLTPGAIAKLAPAADPRETLILVGSGEGGALVMWGLIFIGDTSFSVNLRMRPAYLLVHGFRPGGFFIRWKTRAVVRYAGGVAYWYSRNDETITSLLRPAAVKAAFDLKIPTGAAISEALQQVATRMVNAGHGGTLLVYDRIGAPGRMPERLEVPAHGTFARPDTTLRDAMVEYEQFISTPTDPNVDRAKIANDRHRLSRTYRDAIDHVARLAHVDGAVLMRTDLSVVGFGSTIDVDKAATFTLGHFDPQTHATRAKAVRDLSGHRHKSAAHFCAAQTPKPGPGDPVVIIIAFAIVASQDGKLSLFTISPGLTGSDVIEFSPLILGDAA